MNPAIFLGGLLSCLAWVQPGLSAAELSLARDVNWLVIKGPHLPGGEMRVNYIESYCRAGSTDADWVMHTKIPHRSEMVSLSADGKTLVLRDTLSDGVIIDHTITAGNDDVDFRVVAHNPTTTASAVHWAQPCVRLGAFCGYDVDYTKGDANDYLGKCFVFLEGKLERLPTMTWATKARNIPGQVWCPMTVPRTDVNPRPLNPQVPSNGLIGCFSGDDKLVFATAWEPHQELFQGVARCLHADFRIGGLDAGQTKQVRGKIYLVQSDIPTLMQRYATDFPEQQR